MTREEVGVIEKLSVVKLFNISQKFVNQFHARRQACVVIVYIYVINDKILTTTKKCEVKTYKIKYFL